VRALVNAGASDDDIIDVFKAHPRGIGAKTTRRW
jgi:hypothetical protein